MAREIYSDKNVMALITVISDAEEHKYDEIPGWDGGYTAVGERAVLLFFPNAKEDEIWFPFSQLRKTEDGLSLYASRWILYEKGL